MSAIVYVDEAFAWIVVLGSFLSTLICMGFVRSYSILLTEFKDHNGASNSIMLLSSGCLTASIALTSSFSHCLSQQIGTRLAMMLSAVFCCGVCILLSWTQNQYIYVLLITLLGVSISMAYVPAICMPSKCHQRHLSLANAMGNCGSSVGLIAAAPIIYILLEQYAIQGCFLVLGGIFLHLTAAGVMMPNYIVNSCTGSTIYQPECALFHDNTARHTSNNYCNASPWREFLKVIEKHGRFKVLLFIISMSIFGFGNSCQYATWSGFGKDCALSPAWVTLTLMLSGILDLFTRLSLGFICDKNVVSKAVLLKVAFLVMSCNAMMTLLSQTLPAFIIYSLLYVLSSGTYMAVLMPLTTEAFTVQDASCVYSTILCVQGVVSIIGQYVLGLICDWFGNYRSGIFSGGLLIALTLLLYTLVELILRQKENHWKARFQLSHGSDQQ